MGKRARLVEAAVNLAYRQGYTRTTIADIAKESGVPLGNVYYYFKTKDDIATAILDRLLHHSHVITIRGDSYRLREKRRSGLLQKPAAAHETTTVST